MPEKKKLDESITTIKNLRYATQDVPDSTQLYVQFMTASGDWSSLIEVTEIQLNLPKDKNDVPMLILRSV